MTTEYKAENIKVFEGFEGVRKNFDVFEISKRVKKKGDILTLSTELKIKPRILNSAIDEARILNLLPTLSKSKAGILSRLRTDREVLIFSKRYNLKKVSARKLISLVRNWNKKIQINPLELVSKEEHEFLIGTLLGDSSIRQRNKNSCFRVSHSIKQKQYIQEKFIILSNFNLSEFYQKERIIQGRKFNAIFFSTKTHPIFNYYRNLFYDSSGNKKVTEKILRQLSPRGLAYWVCDDGSFNLKQKYLILCTNSFSLEEHKLIKKFFKIKFNLNPFIGFRDKKYYYLRFNKEDTLKLIKIINPFVSNYMSYKIGGIK
jgi:hypothetical protein